MRLGRVPIFECFAERVALLRFFMQPRSLVQPKSKIHLEYSLETEDSVLEATPVEAGFWLELGAGRLHPALENVLVGLQEGENFETWLDPTLTFGTFDDNLKFEIHQSKITRLLPDWKIGMSFEAPGPDGKPKLFRILATDGTRVTVDGNHPFAGQDLLFKGRVISVQSPS